MKHISLIKALQKAGFKIESGEGSSHYAKWQVTFHTTCILWSERGGDVHFLSLGRTIDNTDIDRDYFDKVPLCKIKNAICHLENARRAYERDMQICDFENLKN